MLSLETVFKDLKGSQAEIMTSTATGKGRTEVETAARFVHVFLSKENSHLRVCLSEVSDGGVFFVGNIHARTACAAFRYLASDSGSGQPGIGADQFIRSAVARLCDRPCSIAKFWDVARGLLREMDLVVLSLGCNLRVCSGYAVGSARRSS